MKTLLSDTPGASAACVTLGRQRRWRYADRRSFAPPIDDRRSSASPKGAKRCLHPACPPRSHHNSLFTLQSTPPHSPAAVSLNLLRTSRTPVASRNWVAAVRRWCLSVQLRCTCRPAKFCFAGGGGERIRTDDLLLAKQALSQLSYTPDRAQTSEHLWSVPSGWWAREDLNLRPHAYQARALTS